MPIRGTLFLRNGGEERRTFHSWQIRDGWLSWPGYGHYHTDPELYTRRFRHPLWHYVALLPLLLPRLFARQEDWAQYWIEGDPVPRDVRGLRDEVVKRVWGRTADGIRMSVVADGVRDLLSRKGDWTTLLLLLSIVMNVALVIVLAVRTVT